jgi:hypothetical protein
MNRLLIPLLMIGLGIVACTDDPNGIHENTEDTLTVSVMTRNAYVGADVDAVIAALGTADPNDDLAVLTEAIATLGATDFPARAQAFADEIATAAPHVVGFAEISFIDIDLTPMGMDVDFTLDFLPILEAALAERDLNYEVGAQVKNIDVSVAGGLVHLMDYDVVLYDADRVDWTTVHAANFVNNIPPEMLPPGLVLKRGWIWGRAEIDGATIDIVSTHPESGGDGDPTNPLSELRAGQAFEIVSAIEGVSPVVLMGDLNDQPGSPLYNVLTGAAFTDVWPLLHEGETGNTCCHEYDLANATAAFTKRIDYIFVRGMQHPGSDYPSSLMTLVGDDPADRVTGPAYPIWPSDHAGLVATMLVVRPGATQ